MQTKRIMATITSLTVVGLLTTAVLDTALGNSPTVPRDKDVAAVESEVDPPKGGDERMQIPPGRLIAGNGVVEPADREIKVASQVPGRVARVRVHEGDWVDPGAVLIELESEAERAALLAAEADVALAEAELARSLRGLRREDRDAVFAETEAARARSALSSSTLERIENLARAGAATQDELDRSRRTAEAERMALQAAQARWRAAAAGSRREDVLSARARHEAAKARRDQQAAMLDRLTIRAPIASEVLQVKIRTGEYYNPSASEALVVLGDTRVLRVRMDVEERDVGKVTLGAAAFVIADAFSDRRFAGRVVELGRRMGRKNLRTDDPKERIDTKILEAVIELQDHERLVPGLRVKSYVGDDGV